MIKTIKWRAHPILGDLELDFTKPDGTPYSTIVIAGVNGTGKTTIFETLSSFLNRGTLKDFDHIEYAVNGVDYLIENPKDYTGLTDWVHIRKNLITGDTRKIDAFKSYNPSRIDIDFEDLRHYGYTYSKARSGFNTKKIKSSTIKQLDSDKYEDDASDDFTSIKQLIVDIIIQDNANWMDITKSHQDISFDEFRIGSKEYRFENAFNSFFNSLKFIGSNHNNPEEISINFEKHGKVISIDELSTGEKQIVFRGAHLLKNIDAITGGIVMIDEPELSLHPTWEQRILSYYKNLFIKNGLQTVQMLISTHSDYVIRSALEDKDNTLVIVLSDDGGIIKSNKITTPMYLPTVTFAETNYIAFGVYSKDYHIELYGYMQQQHGLKTITECDCYIENATSYDNTIHSKPDSFTDKKGHTRTYKTLPTYIRNAIDHPDSNRSFTDEELKISIELLQKLI
ncbi:MULTISPECIES: AAA family ATPase [Erysipelotrichaceae]|uniref:AAA family ATPase n=1 Tax=Erysipelotrichaceae TaxID=128827 RepID=UPI00272C3330|nr:MULTISPECIES: ATP-binding protein [Erysipelotrichaceae]